jgi:hypothetical protein
MDIGNLKIYHLIYYVNFLFIEKAEKAEAMTGFMDTDSE